MSFTGVTCYDNNEWSEVTLKTLIIIAHPDVSDSGSQQFLIESSRKLEQVTHYYLTDKSYQVEEEQRRLLSYDRILFQFPMYWYSAPYLLKKWIDEVFTNKMIDGLLKNKELGLVITLGLSEKAFSAGMSEKFTLSELFKPFEALANKCQMTYLPIFPVALFSYLKEKQKRELLISYQQYVTKENKTTFKSQEEWFINKFTDLLKQKPVEEQARLSVMLEEIVANSENLDELLFLVKEMRNEDD